MRVRSNPSLALFSILTGGAFAVMATTAGCGSKTDDGTVTPADTGSISLSDASADTTKPDTAAPMMDTATQYDVPGSLFDVTVPDIAFEGGKTIGGCYSCTTDKCKSQVEACDTDPKCRGLVLCGLTECAGNFSDLTCLIGCATKYDVALDPSDPTVTKALGVGQCVQGKCADACPLPADGGMMSSDAKADTASEAASDSAMEASAFMIFPHAAQKPADPEVVERLQDLFNMLGGMPETRANLVDTFSKPR